MSKLLMIAKAKGNWTIIAVCAICGTKRRTVISIIKHINEEHI